MNEVDLEKANREAARWYILRALDAGRPKAVNENIVHQVLTDTKYDMTPHQLRRELDYLADRKLVTITGKDSPVWAAELTSLGVDVVEYTAECRPGIARPPKW